MNLKILFFLIATFFASGCLNSSTPDLTYEQYLREPWNDYPNIESLYPNSEARIPEAISFAFVGEVIGVRNEFGEPYCRIGSAGGLTVEQGKQLTESELEQRCKEAGGTITHHKITFIKVKAKQLMLFESQCEIVFDEEKTVNLKYYKPKRDVLAGARIHGVFGTVYPVEWDNTTNYWTEYIPSVSLENIDFEQIFDVAVIKLNPPTQQSVVQLCEEVNGEIKHMG